MKNSIQNFKNLFLAFEHLSFFQLRKNKNPIFTKSFSLRFCLVAALSLLAFTGCESDSDVLILEEESINELHLSANEGIFDGANGGTEGFYFLPPMVKAPSYSGTFDAGLSPIIEICETTECLTIHASFSMDEGEGSELVRVDEEGEHYIVNWHTDQTGTVVGQTYRIRVSIAGTVLGHADVQMAENGKDAKNITDGEAIALVDGRTLPIKIRIEEGTVFVIGSEGGTLSSSDGLVSLEIPANALDEKIGITVNPVEDELNDPDVVPGALFDFGPSPYTFTEEVTLTIKYDPANLPDGISENELRLLAVVDGEWVQLPGSSVDIENSTVTGPLNSFSRKGVGRGKVHEITLVPAEASIDVGETVQFGAVVTNVDGEEMSRNVQWSSSDEAIGTVGNSGLATGVALGQATIEAKSGKVSSAAVLTVESASLGIMGKTITAGETHSCGLTPSGEAYCWGQGLSGRLGIGGIRYEIWEPTKVIMPSGVSFASISAGRTFTLALTTTGDVFRWGDAFYTYDPETSPIKVEMPAGVSFVAISAGDHHNVALSSTGTVYTWGRNNFGQLGNGTTEFSDTPTAVSLPLGVRVTSISAGGGHTLALTATGEAYAWGQNNWGQLGNNSKVNSYTPVRIEKPEGINFIDITAGTVHNLALSTTGDVYSWGHNGPGKLGSIPISPLPSAMHDTPTIINMPAGVSFASVSAGYWTSMAISTTGTVYSWGGNHFGELGYNSELTGSNIPSAVLMPPGVSFVSLDAGSNHIIAISTTGEGYAWGRTQYGMLTIGGGAPAIYSPQQMRGGIFFAQ